MRAKSERRRFRRDNQRNKHESDDQEKSSTAIGGSGTQVAYRTQAAVRYMPSSQNGAKQAETSAAAARKAQKLKAAISSQNLVDQAYSCCVAIV